MGSLFWSLDGKEYSSDQEVLIGCNDCAGCSQCCREMGDTIILDPYDVWMMTSSLKIAGGGQPDFDLLVSEDGPLELKLHGGLVLPNIKMVLDEYNIEEESGVCPFLNEKGRCSIHFCRPGLCRLYPLARNFTCEDGEERFCYFILDEKLGCPTPKTSSEKIGDWLGIRNLKEYERFILKWKQLRRKTAECVEKGGNETLIQEFLILFYQRGYGSGFFAEFEKRAEIWLEKSIT